MFRFSKTLKLSKQSSKYLLVKRNASKLTNDDPCFKPDPCPESLHSCRTIKIPRTPPVRCPTTSDNCGSVRNPVCSQPKCSAQEGIDDCKPKNNKFMYGAIALLLMGLTTGLLYYLGYLDDNKGKPRKISTDECVVKEKEEYNDENLKRKSKMPIGKKEKSPPSCLLKTPRSAKDIPKQVQYLLIGGGTASFSAVKSIQSLDPAAQVLVVTDEVDYPYMRPPLSKEMWLNRNPDDVERFRFKPTEGSARSIHFEGDNFYTDVKKIKAPDKSGVAVARGWKVAKIDPFNREVELEGGAKICYNKCLLATGGHPKIVPPFSFANEEMKKKLFYFKTKNDFEQLYDTLNCADIDSVTIVGGGFLGCELAYSLSSFGQGKYKVTHVFKENGALEKILPEYLSLWINKQLVKEGVSVLSKTTVNDFCLKNDCLELKLSNGKAINTDIVIAAVGSEPNTELAKNTTGLEVHPNLGGYIVNSELQASSNLYVAGDAACFFDPKLGRRRVEHHDHAVVSGRLAGENMVGAGKPYTHQSMFWSDLGPNIGFEAVGMICSSLSTVGVFSKSDDFKKDEKLSEQGCDENGKTKKENSPDEDNFRKGVVFYIKDETVVGVLLWNVFNKMHIARTIVEEGRKYNELKDVVRQLNIHE